MPARQPRQLVALSALVALVALVVAVVFFATSHPLRGIALLVIAAIAGGFGFFTARR